jgi:hypothetical protein
MQPGDTTWSPKFVETSFSNTSVTKAAGGINRGVVVLVFFPFLEVLKKDLAGRCIVSSGVVSIGMGISFSSGERADKEK